MKANNWKSAENRWNGEGKEANFNAMKDNSYFQRKEVSE